MGLIDEEALSADDDACAQLRFDFLIERKSPPSFTLLTHAQYMEGGVRACRAHAAVSHCRPPVRPGAVVDVHGCALL